MDNHKIMYVKDVQNTLGVSDKTARSYLSDIKQQYDIKVVLWSHFSNYFKIPF